MLPTLSDDAYRYVWDGVVQAQEGKNPYLHKPDALADLHNEPIYERLNSKSYFTVYPPISQLVFALGGTAYGGGWKASFYVIKGVLVLFEIAALLLLARLVQARTLILYAWHPLVIIETAGQAHTESIMVFFMVAVVWAIHTKREGLASAVLACAGWVKLYPFVLLPLLQIKRKTILFAGITIVGLGALYAAPNVLSNVRSSLDLYVGLFEYNAGLYYAIKEMLFWWTGDDWSKWLGPRMRLVFLAVLPLIYVASQRYKWPFFRGAVLALGTYFVLTTTIHPWYLLAVLPLTLLAERPAWHWHWLGIVSIGTYLFYIGGPYWIFVIVGWGGWCVLAIWRNHALWINTLQRARAYGKYRTIQAYLPKGNNAKVLDLGAGEGYVGQHIANQRKASVTLLDVVDFNQTDMPLQIYDGVNIPAEDKAFDAVVLYFVLHHSQGAAQVLHEAKRVGKRVIVVESTYSSQRGLRLLTFLDKRANRLRSKGLMRGQEEHLHFKTVGAWIDVFEELGVRKLEQRRWGRWIHQQVLFVFDG